MEHDHAKSRRASVSEQLAAELRRSGKKVSWGGNLSECAGVATLKRSKRNEPGAMTLPIFSDSLNRLVSLPLDGLHAATPINDCQANSKSFVYETFPHKRRGAEVFDRKTMVDLRGRCNTTTDKPLLANSWRSPGATKSKVRCPASRDRPNRRR